MTTQYDPLSLLVAPEFFLLRRLFTISPIIHMQKTTLNANAANAEGNHASGKTEWVCSREKRSSKSPPFRTKAGRIFEILLPERASPLAVGLTGMFASSFL